MGFKDSPLGLIPDDWDIVNLGDVASSSISNSFVDGPFGSNLKTSEYTEKGVRIIQLQNIGDGYWNDDNKKYISTTKFEQLKRHVAYPNDIAIAKMAEPLARACLIPDIDDKYVVVADCIKLTPNLDEYNLNYLVNTINYSYFRQQAEKKGTGTTRLRINLSVLKTILVIKPPRKEQEKIAEILDKVDSAIALTEALIKKLKQIKAGLLQDLLTRGLDDNGELRNPDTHPEQFKDSPLGKIPISWEVVTIENIIHKVVGGGTPSRFINSYWDGNIPWASVKDFTDDKKFLEDTEEHISSDGLFKSTSNLIESNTLIICTRMAVGRVAITTKSIAINQDLKALYLQSNIHVTFLFYALKFIRYKIESVSIGSTVKGINVEHLLKIYMNLPPLNEQEKIAKILDTQEKAIEKEEQYLKKLKQKKQGLMQDLLTGKVRVNHL